MRSKQGVDYCVACNELDSDDVKDNPGIICYQIFIIGNLFLLDILSVMLRLMLLICRYLNIMFIF